jgi:outer membrane immunogenic protein
MAASRLNSGQGIQMKKLALGLVGLAVLVAAPAMAADLAARPMPVKAMAPPVFSWTGCYLGVHVGGGWQVSSFTSNEGQNSGVGVLGGAQAGCNLQWRQFVIGVEGEFWGSTLHDREFFEETTFRDDAYSRNRWDGAISVRSGVAFDRAFIYGKLGVVWGKFDYTRDQTDTGIFGGTETIRGDAIATGVLLGVGFEYALTDNWTTKLEYNYIDYGNKIVNFTEVDCEAVCETRTFSFTVKERKQFIKLGVNYKF